MDVDELAPALLALDDLYRQARTLLTPDAPAVKLKVSRVHDGSLIVDFNLVQVAFAGLVEMLNTPTSTALTALIDYVSGAKGLLPFIKRMKGSPPQSVESIGDDKVRVGNAEGDYMETTERVVRAYGSMNLRTLARGVVGPVEADGVDRMELRDHMRDTTFTLGKPDVPFFDVPYGRTAEHCSRGWFHVASPSFFEKYKWRLVDAGGKAFMATMADPAFLAKVADREIPFRAGDDLYCEIIERETLGRSGEVSVSRTITKVLDRRAGLEMPRHLQLSMDNLTKPEDPTHDDDED